MDRSLEKVNSMYDMEINKIIRTIKKEKAKKVLLQFPDGLKPYSQAICDEINSKIGSDCFIWLESCFGACDLPIGVDKIGIDLVIQFGHSSWSYNRKDIQAL